MANTGLCPYCRKPLNEANLEEVLCYIDANRAVRGSSISCKSCNKVLSVSVDEELSVEVVTPSPLDRLLGRA